jgi:large subunit ribosomal protein L10
LSLDERILFYMAISKKEKEATLASLTTDLKNARSVVFSEYRGMTVKQLDNLRKTLRKENVKYQVIKVTLLKKALASLGINTDGLKYNGPLSVAISTEEETAPARILKGMMKDSPQIVFDGGIFNNEFIGVDMVNKLASVPSKQQLLTQLVYVLTGNVRSLMYALNAIKEKKQ